VPGSIRYNKNERTINKQSFMPLSYNDEQQQASELRHLFLPTSYMLAVEVVVAVAALTLLNLSALSGSLSGAGDSINASPFSLWSRVLDKLLSPTQHATVQEVLLFIIWAIVGALVYVVVFRSLQILLRTRSSLQQGVSLVQAQHSQGAMRYFASLHDFFIRLVIGLLGTAAILTGALLCFAIASQQLSSGLDNSFPSSLGNFIIAFAGAFIAVRVIVVGTSLLSPRFRGWYDA
jgi:hypothetical protein